jgi:glycosyltransferase involved in cell wall biosynthesis
MGLPVIAVNHEGVNEAVVNGEGGILLNEVESELLPAILQLAQDTELRNELGKQGRERVLRDFNEEEQFGKLNTLI